MTTKTSYNGWPHIPKNRCRTFAIPGTVDPRYSGAQTRPLTVLLRPDNTGILLAYHLAWFHKKIEPLDRLQYDDHGWGIRPSDTSCHPSATAVDWNAEDHRQFRRGTFTKEQTAAIRQRVAASNKTVAWGGDWSDARVDEMHLEIGKVNHIQVTAELTRMLLAPKVYPMLRTVMDVNGISRLYIKAAA